MNTKYASHRKAINLLSPKQWDGYEPKKLANLNLERAWQVVREFPACVGLIPNATADMQAYALKSRGILLFESVPWLIDTEFVAPGSTAWALHFAADYAKYRDNFTLLGQYFRMKTLEDSWSELRPIAEFAPEALPQHLRNVIADAPYPLLRQFISTAKQINKSRRSATVGA
jgi:hypothetical protein